MAGNLHIDASTTGVEEIKALKGQFSAAKLAGATRMAVNDTLRWARTQIRRSIQETYNIKAKRINDKNPEKGLKAILARDSDLNGRITAGHKPVNLSSLNRTRQTSKGVSIQLIQGGSREVIQRAFKIGKYGDAVFARGQYSGFGFLFRGGKGSRKRTTGPDAPISAINTVSIATAATNTRAIAKWHDPTTEHYNIEVKRQITRLFNKS